MKIALRNAVPGPAESGLVVVGWLPWVAIILVAGVVGGTLGLTGVFGHPTSTRAVVTSDASVARSAVAYACPGGPAIDTLEAGDRVLAMQRSADSAFLGVRDPLNLGRLLWVRLADVSIDADQAGVATLPTGTCPDVSVILMPPTSQGGAAGTAPAQPSGPAPAEPPAPDTTSPNLGAPTAGTPIVCLLGSNPPHSDTISVTASDNVDVSSVSISWTGKATGSAAMSRSGSTWSYTYTVLSSTAFGTVTFQLQARDAAGNLSSPANLSITQEGCVG
jgi:hypothetical protein